MVLKAQKVLNGIVRKKSMKNDSTVLMNARWVLSQQVNPPLHTKVNAHVKTRLLDDVSVPFSVFSWTKSSKNHSKDALNYPAHNISHNKWAWLISTILAQLECQGYRRIAFSKGVQSPPLEPVCPFNDLRQTLY